MKGSRRSPSVLVTRKLPISGREIVGSDIELRVWEEDRPMPRKELLEGLRGKDAVICLLNDRMDREAMDAGSDLKVIANYAVGYDNIDVKLATERGIMVLNTPGVLTDATADLAFALMLAAARRLGESERYVRSGSFSSWGPELMMGKDVWGATLGVVGAGKIGSAVLRRGKGFNMRLKYHSRTRKPELERELGAEWTSLDELLKTSDFISLNCPLTDETRHMIGRRELELMKEDAVLVNTARGPVVDEKALYEALREGSIFGAGLDVYEDEPRVYPPLMELENVVLLPHVGSATFTTRTRMARMAFEGVKKAISGMVPENLVNVDVLKGKE